MNDKSTTSILQRVSLILAVTAASYGLPLQSHAQAQRGATEAGRMSKPAATAHARAAQERRLGRHG